MMNFIMIGGPQVTAIEFLDVGEIYSKVDEPGASLNN